LEDKIRSDPFKPLLINQEGAFFIPEERRWKRAPSQKIHRENKVARGLAIR